MPFWEFQLPLFQSLPMLVVGAIGISLAWIYREIWPKPARLLAIGCLFLIFNDVLPRIPRMLMRLDVRNDSIYFILFLASSYLEMLNAAAAAIMIAAVCVDREPDLPDIVHEAPNSTLAYAREQLDKDAPWSEIEAALQAQGLEGAIIEAVRAQLDQDRITRLRVTSNKNLQFGGLLCAGAIGATQVSLAVERRIGWKYVLVYCAVTYGLYHVILGLRQRLRADHPDED